MVREQHFYSQLRLYFHRDGQHIMQNCELKKRMKIKSYLSVLHFCFPRNAMKHTMRAEEHQKIRFAYKVLIQFGAACARIMIFVQAHGYINNTQVQTLHISKDMTIITCILHMILCNVTTSFSREKTIERDKKINLIFNASNNKTC